MATILGSALAPRQRRLLGLGTAFLFASMVITFVWNVPLNNTFATYTELDSRSAALARSEFEDPWNQWNLVRTGTSLIGAACVTAALVLTPRGRAQHRR